MSKACYWMNMLKMVREIQRKRYMGDNILTNSEMNSKNIEKYCPVDCAGELLLKKAIETYHLSTRSYYRVLKIARTVADLDCQEHISNKHILEALQYQAKGAEV